VTVHDISGIDALRSKPALQGLHIAYACPPWPQGPVHPARPVEADHGHPLTLGVEELQGQVTRAHAHEVVELIDNQQPPQLGEFMRILDMGHWLVLHEHDVLLRRWVQHVRVAVHCVDQAAPRRDTDAPSMLQDQVEGTWVGCLVTAESPPHARRIMPADRGYQHHALAPPLQ